MCTSGLADLSQLGTCQHQLCSVAPDGAELPWSLRCIRLKGDFNAYYDTRLLTVSDETQALATCSEFRPSIDISVGGESSDEGVGAGKARTEYRSAVAA